MISFKEQLIEDFQDYRERYPNIANIDKDEWAFNYWVLDNLFSIDDGIIEDYIVDYNDKGIDCYVWHEEEQDLYLIQNKFYDENTKLSVDYINNDFLTRAIGALEKGTYTRSKELQDIFNKFSGSENFAVHFYLYVTNNSSKTTSVMQSIADFNKKSAEKKYDAKIFSLDEIKELYYQDPIKDKKKFEFTLKSINKGTILNVDNNAYKLTLAVDAKYVLTPVTVVYDLYEKAKKSKYPLFDENIREYLGANGPVNKKIMATLKDPDDRKNFFFYNNGITMIVNDITKETHDPKEDKRVFDVVNPQIVNGCQTVSTIYETLNSLPQESLEKDFSNSYVMIKILKIPDKDEKLKDLYHNIVTYNNSQNSINERNFTAIKEVFKQLKEQLEWSGMLLCIKQSDKKSYVDKYKMPTELIDKCKALLDRFGLVGFKKTKDFCIELEKLLQAILAFDSTPRDAICNKSKLLKDKSVQNEKVTSFIMNKATTKTILYLYLLYLRAEQEKKNSKEDIKPNPFYFVYCFSHYECGSDADKIIEKLASKEDVDSIIKKYNFVFKLYYKSWKEDKPSDGYNDIIKSNLDVVKLDKAKMLAEDTLKMFQS